MTSPPHTDPDVDLDLYEAVDPGGDPAPLLDAEGGVQEWDSPATAGRAAVPTPARSAAARGPNKAEVDAAYAARADNSRRARRRRRLGGFALTTLIFASAAASVVGWPVVLAGLGVAGGASAVGYGAVKGTQSGNGNGGRGGRRGPRNGGAGLTPGGRQGRRGLFGGVGGRRAGGGSPLGGGRRRGTGATAGAGGGKHRAGGNPLGALGRKAAAAGAARKAAAAKTSAAKTSAAKSGGTAPKKSPAGGRHAAGGRRGLFGGRGRGGAGSARRTAGGRRTTTSRPVGAGRGRGSTGRPPRTVAGHARQAKRQAVRQAKQRQAQARGRHNATAQTRRAAQRFARRQQRTQQRWTRQVTRRAQRRQRLAARRQARQQIRDAARLARVQRRTARRAQRRTARQARTAQSRAHYRRYFLRWYAATRRRTWWPIRRRGARLGRRTAAGFRWTRRRLAIGVRAGWSRISPLVALARRFRLLASFRRLNPGFGGTRQRRRFRAIFVSYLRRLGNGAAAAWRTAVARMFDRLNRMLRAAAGDRTQRLEQLWKDFYQFLAQHRPRLRRRPPATPTPARPGPAVPFRGMSPQERATVAAALGMAAGAARAGQTRLTPPRRPARPTQPTARPRPSTRTPRPAMAVPQRPAVRTPRGTRPMAQSTANADAQEITHPTWEAAMSALQDQVATYQIPEDNTGVLDVDSFIASIGGFMVGFSGVLDSVGEYLAEGPTNAVVVETLGEFSTAISAMAADAAQVYEQWRTNEDNAHDLRRAEGEINRADLFNVGG